MKKDVEKIAKYGAYGAITTVFNIALFVLLKKLGMYYILANTVSYLLAVFFNYVLNKKFVFQTKTKENKKDEFMRFLIARALFACLENILFYLVVEKLHFHPYAGKIGLSIVVIILTFYINNVFVFKE